ncbi:RagB/SusD family nutrient uptake outer membrane protein [Sabulibacter ruber]|uniref:RagB/SusD family nutrient uptake outer membrane protein n=1 Tax=Sabulibacter ruber TaxID=2811901 RepID=UPI001A95C86E|nr:RagB/SusD family nutrient uptake outer membrane protein [Sabulibacter ruber]
MRSNLIHHQIKLFLVVLLLLGSSCKDFLDLAPISSPTDSNFWKNEKEADAAVAAGYALTRKALYAADGMAHFAYGDLPTAEFVSTLGGWTFGDVGRVNWSLGISDINSPMVQLRSYNNFYRIIDQANRCMKFLPTVPLEEFTSSDAEAARNHLMGEAYFLRAFSYFYMARVWGGVPLVLESVDVTKAEHLSRATEQEVLDQCVKDLAAALPLLRMTHPDQNNRAVRANKGAAYALLAHVYAWKGDYQKCAEAAAMVTESNLYSLVDRSQYLTIFKGKSPEGIFEIASSDPNESAGSGSIAFRTLKTPYLSTNSGNAEFTLNSGYLNELYSDPADLRLQNGFAFLGTTDPISIKYANIVYTQANQTMPIAQNNIIVFRLADIKLLEAEALAATDRNGEARQILNEIRAKAGLPEWSGEEADLFEAVMEERQRELFLEGHTFYDLVRLGRRTGLLKFGEGRISETDFAAGKYYWPLDPILLRSNPKLVQTPFWTSRM